MEADEDALEAIVCWFSAGNPQEAVRTRDTHRWSGAGWPGMAAGALVGTMLGADRAQILKMAEAAVATGQANHDAFAIYLMALQFAGRVGDAYQRILAGLTEVPPRETLLATVVGDIAVAAGNWQLARHAANVVLTLNPGDVRALLVGSFAAVGLDQAYEALGLAQRAIAIAPGAPPAVFQMMRCLNSIGDYYGTVGSFARIKNPAGAAPQILSQLGIAYAALGKTDLAVQAYGDALAGGGAIEAIRGLLRIELESGYPVQSAELVAKFRREIDADNDATFVLGLMALDRGERDAAMELLRRSMRVTAAGKEFLVWPVTEPHIRHEYEQLLLLQERGKLGAHRAGALPLLKKYYDRSGDPAASFGPEGAEGEALRNALAPYHHMPDKPVTGPALAAQDYAAIEAQYRAGKPAMVVIDNFLSPQALADLREFCEEASIFKTAYSTGYMGAFLSGGFSPPVLLAIAEELRRVMPEVVGPHPLMQSWAFKYDQRRQGINLHADFARVNVNFWITPDEACADPATGGMVIYDAPAPSGWNFQDYNSDSDKMMAFVRLHGAQPIRVPYKENRCVLFDSTLFHTTDEIHFKPGYTNRRVNVTLLYGPGTEHRLTRLLIGGRDGPDGCGWAAQEWEGGRVTAAGRADADLATPAAAQLVADLRPDLVINAAAWTDVEAAEGDAAARDAAFRINGAAPGELAQACLAIGAWLIHYSTDYVFDGTSPGAYKESDPPNPLNVYGASKLAGEAAVAASGCKHLILRTSWVYSRDGDNFLTRIIARARDAARLPVVADQHGAPTWACSLADAARLAARRCAADPAAQNLSGLYHLTAAGRCSWFEYAQTALTALGITATLEPVSAAAFPQRARRPANSVLDASLFAGRFGWAQPQWQDDLRRCLAELR